MSEIKVIPMTTQPCSRCLRLALDGHIRTEMVQPLPADPFAPRARDRSGKCCRDCAAADGLVAHLRGRLDFLMARIVVGNDRQEQLRLPGVNTWRFLLAGLVAPSEPGDLDKHLAWLDENNWFGIDEDRRHPAG